MEKIILIGIDAADADFIRKNLSQLPYFQKILENGFCHENKVMPPITIPNWPSIFSGCNFEKIGFLNFRRYKNGKLELFNSSYWKNKSIFNRLSKAGKKSLGINIPGLYPVWDDSFADLVAGMISPELNQNKKIFNKKRYIVEGRTKADCKKAFNIKTATFLDICDNYDFASIVIRYIDSLNHQPCSDYYAHFIEVYKEIDSFLERLLQKNINVFLVSDHGTTIYRKELYINELLKKHGLLIEKRKSVGQKIKQKLRRSIRKICADSKLIEIPAILVYKTIQKLTIKKQKDIETENKLGIIPEFIDLKNSKAFAIKSLGNTCFIHVLKEKYKKQVKEILAKCKHIKEAREFPEGKNPAFFIRADKQFIVNDMLQGRSVIEPIPGFLEHSDRFMFCGYGKDIKKGILHKNIKIEDITPTILHMLGLKIPKDCDGIVLRSIFKEKSAAYTRKVRYEKKDTKNVIENINI
ncbi:alkaline phosphatase family protein [Candidatus Woesearchaeota archaeon]|nr:alkaline phosphatase family protein [Candidatus Woesearchaeota archaeon]